MIGPIVPIPAPEWLVTSLESASVSLNDEGTSGAQLSFTMGRNGARDLLDYPHLIRQYLRPFNRVILTVIVRGIPRVLFDGVIVNQNVTASNEPGQSKVSITCEDLTVLLDERQRKFDHKPGSVPLIVGKILGQYLAYGVKPVIIPGVSTVKESLAQNATDLEFLRTLAKENGKVFYIASGPLPGVNIGYFGPKLRIPIPQPALTVNMGPMTNVKSLNFTNDFKKPTLYETEYIDDNFNFPFKMINFIPPLPYIPPLAPIPSWAYSYPYIKRRFLEKKSEEKNGGEKTESGEVTNSTVEVIAKLFAESSKSNEDAVSASGELDVASYGHVLMPRLLVGVRGAGFTYDGLYYVKSVTSNIKPSSGSFTQSFQLSRDGVGSITPVLPV